MSKKHFEAFAAEAREWRRTAKLHATAGDKAKEDYAYAMAIGIEYATINVAKKFNARFDEARFRAACNPDNKISG